MRQNYFLAISIISILFLGCGSERDHDAVSQMESTNGAKISLSRSLSDYADKDEIIEKYSFFYIWALHNIYVPECGDLQPDKSISIENISFANTHCFSKENLDLNMLEILRSSDKTEDLNISNIDNSSFWKGMGFDDEARIIMISNQISKEDAFHMLLKLKTSQTKDLCEYVKYGARNKDDIAAFDYIGVKRLSHLQELQSVGLTDFEALRPWIEVKKNLVNNPRAITVVRISMWVREGYTPEEASSWISIGIVEPMYLNNWREAFGNISPEDLSVWKDVGFKLTSNGSTLQALSQSGLTPDQYMEWLSAHVSDIKTIVALIEQGIDSDQVKGMDLTLNSGEDLVKLKRAGLSNEEVKEFLKNIGVDTYFECKEILPEETTSFYLKLINDLDMDCQDYLNYSSQGIVDLDEIKRLKLKIE